MQKLEWPFPFSDLSKSKPQRSDDICHTFLNRWHEGRIHSSFPWLVCLSILRKGWVTKYLMFFTWSLSSFLQTKKILDYRWYVVFNLGFPNCFTHNRERSVKKNLVVYWYQVCFFKSQSFLFPTIGVTTLPLSLLSLLNSSFNVSAAQWWVSFPVKDSTWHSWLYLVKAFPSERTSRPIKHKEKGN